MTTQPDQDRTIECDEFHILMMEYRGAQFGAAAQLRYKEVIAFVDEKLKPAPDKDQMTLRDQFAMAALNALIAKEYKDDVKRGAKGVPIFAQYAYEYADAMMEARKPK